MRTGTGLQAGQHRCGWSRIARLGKSESDAERIAALKENLLFLAMHACRQEARIAATKALLDRLDGVPAQKVHVGQDVQAAPLGVVLIPRKDGD